MQDMLLSYPWPASHSEKSLSLGLAKQISVTLVSGKLDYSLFHNILETDIAK